MEVGHAHLHQADEKLAVHRPGREHRTGRSAPYLEQHGRTGRRQRLLARHLHLPDAVCSTGFDAATQQVWLQFEGVNATADVTLNGQRLVHHDGGYSTFRADITGVLAGQHPDRGGGQQPQRFRLSPESGLYLLRRYLPGCKPHRGQPRPYRPGLSWAAAACRSPPPSMVPTPWSM